MPWSPAGSAARLLFLPVFLVAGLVAPSAAQSTTWTGAVDSAWSNAGNWTAGVPDALTNATVGATATTQPTTAGAPAQCASLTISSGGTVTAAPGFPLAVSGGITLTGTGTFAAGGLVSLVGAGTVSSSGTGTLPSVNVASLGTVVFGGSALSITGALTVGSGQLTIGSGSTLLLVTVAGTYTQTGGILQVGTGSGSTKTLQVALAASFQGGSLETVGVGTDGVLDLDANVVFSGTGSTAPPATIRCAGDWTGHPAFAPTQGIVVLDGPGMHTLGGTGVSFNGLTIASGNDVTLGADALLRGSITINGLFSTLAGHLDVNGSATVTGSLNLGSGLHSFAGSFTSTAGTTTGGATVTFDGAGTVALGASSSLPSVQVAATGTVVFSGATMALGGSLTISSGQLTIGSGATATTVSVGSGLALTGGTLQIGTASGSTKTLSVAGSALFQGGTFQGSGTGVDGLLDVDSNTVFSGTGSTLPPATIRCAGDWAGHSLFAPTQGIVVLDGTGMHSLGGSGVSFKDFTIANGNDVTLSADALIRGNIAIDGLFATLAGHLDVNGSATVTGSLNLGSGLHTFAGSFTSTAGTTTGGTKVTFDGAGSVTLGIGSSLPAVDVAATGSVTFAGTALVIQGALNHLSGTLNVGSGTGSLDVDVFGAFGLSSASLAIGTASGGAKRLHVVGAATFAGGTLSGTSNGVLDLDATVSITNTIVSAPPGTISIAGNWTSDTDFNPLSGTVLFDGPAVPPQTISGVTTFNAILVQAGSHVIALDDLTILSTLTVSGTFEANGALVVGVTGSDLIVNPGGTVEIHSTLSSDAKVTVNAGATLDLGSGLHSFSKDLVLSGTLLGNGTVRFAGSTAATVTIAATSSLPNVLVQKSGTTQLLLTGTTVTITGSLTLASGTLAVGQSGQVHTTTVAGTLTQTGGTLSLGQFTSSSQTLQVAGAATFSGGTLTATGSNTTLRLDSSATFSGTISTTPPTTIRCKGNWSGHPSFAPGSSTVSLEGPGSQTISGTGARFFHLTTSSTSQVTAAVPLDVNGTLTVVAGTSLALGAFTHTLAGSVTLQGNLTASGTLRLDGTGTVTANGTSPLPSVEIAHPTPSTTTTFGGSSIDVTGTLKLFSGNLTVGPSSGAHTTTVSGSLTLAGGDLTVGGSTSPVQTLRVVGSASLLGGTLTVRNASTLDVDGSVVFGGTSATGSAVPGTIQCGGDWTAHPGFQPTSGTVEFNGTGAQTIDGASARFHGLTISSPSSTTATLPLDVNGALLVSIGATLGLGSLTHTLGGNSTLSGTLVASGTLRFDGSTTTVTTSAMSELPSVEIALTSGTATFAGSAVQLAGSLSVISGSLTVGSGAGAHTTTVNGALFLTGGSLTVGASSSAHTLHVEGSASLVGGSLSILTNASLELQSGATLSGTVVGGSGVPGTIRCRGDWIGHPAFQPNTGTVVFDRAGAQEIGGFSPRFENLTIASSSNTTATQPLDVNGALLVSSGATLSLGNLTHALGGNVTLQGTLTSSGTLRLDGFGTVTSNATSPLPSVEIAPASGSVTFAGSAIQVMGSLTVISGTLTIGSGAGAHTTTVNGTLSMTGGALTVGSSGSQMLHAKGVAALSGGSLSVLSQATLDVDGNVTLSGSSVGGSGVPGTIRCGGDWTAHVSFQPTTGTVVFDSGVAHTISGTGGRFAAVTVESGSTVTAAIPLNLKGLLTLQTSTSWTSTAGSLDLDSGVSVASGATLSLGSLTHTIDGNTTLSGTLTASGTLRFDGSGLVTASALSPLPNVEIGPGVFSVTFGGTSIQVNGSLTVISGTLTVGSGSGAHTTIVSGSLAVSGGSLSVGSSGPQQLRVLGSASLSGGTLTMVSTATLEVEGHIVLSGTSVGGSVPGTIRCGGDWTAHVSFQPTTGTVVFDNGLAHTISGTGGRFAAVTVESGSTVTAAIPLNLKGVLTLQTSTSWTSTAGSLDLDSGVSVASGATLSLGSLTHTIDGNTTLSGTLTASGTLRFDGSGLVTASALSPLPNVEIGPGVFSVTFGGTSIQVNGNLTVLSGTLGIGSGVGAHTTTVNGALSLTGGNLTVGASGPQVLHVLGSATLQTGTLSVVSAATLDVDGSVTFSGVSVGGSGVAGTIRCGGDWTAHVSFQPTTGTVVFDSGTAHTISGTGGRFAAVTVESGSTVTAAIALNLKGLLTLQGTTTWTNSAASLDLDGGVNVANGATLSLGALTHTIDGNATLSGTLIASGTLRFDGSGLVTASALSPLPNVEIGPGVFSVTFGGTSIQVNGSLTVISGTLTVGSGSGAHTTIVSGSLAVSGGSLSVGSSGPQQLRVLGSASLSGGTLTMVSTATLEVEGHIVLSGTSVGGSVPGTIRCGGDWTAHVSFQPTTGTVVFDNGLAHTISGTGGRFAAVTVESGSTVTAAIPLNLKGLLTLQASSSWTSTAGSLDLDNGVSVASGSTLSLGSLTHTIDGNATLSGTLVASGTLRFDGSGTVTASATSPLPNVEIGPGVFSVTFGGTAIQVDGSLTLLSGTLSIGSGVGAHTTTVLGPLSLLGGTLNVGSFPGPHVLRVIGSASLVGGSLSVLTLASLELEAGVTFSGTVIGGSGVPGTIRCRGDWIAHPTFQPTSGTVEFDGAGAQTIGGASPRFANLTISTSSPLGTTALQPLDVNGTLLLAGGAKLDLGSLTHTLGGNATLQGTLVSSGTLRFDGSSSSVTTNPMSPLPNVEIALTSGGVTFASADVQVNGDVSVQSGTLTAGTGVGAHTTTVAGSLSLTGGTLAVGSFPGAHVLHVEGSANLLRGSLSVASTATFDVDSHLTLSGTSVGGSGVPGTIRCGGDFLANSLFAPTSGTVELDGPGTTLFGPTVAGTTLTLKTLVVKNGVREPASDFSLAATTVTVDLGGTLDIGPRFVEIPSTAITANGVLAVGAGGALALGPTTSVAVGSTGTLRVVGTATQPAVVTGQGGGGYALSVNGTIAAMNFRFEQMGPAGIQIAQSATIAPAPQDLRGGVFDRPSANAGSVLLDIQRPAPAELRYLQFEKSNGVGTYNVRCLGGSTVTLRNWTGAFAGSTFEDDPGNRIVWAPPVQTGVASFTSTAGPGKLQLAWTTSSEVDASAFLLEWSTSPLGPFSLVTELPAAGASTYGAVHTGLTPGFTYHYRLSQRLTHGAIVELATASGVPLSDAPPPGFLQVGGGGPFATIQAAIDAAVLPKSVVLVAAGTYAPFSVTSVPAGSLQIVADGSGTVSIDTTSAPVVVSGLGAGTSLVLAGLEIGSAVSPNRGLDVVGCAGTIVVDKCVVRGGSGQPGLRLNGSTATAIQRTQMQGTPGLLVEAGSLTLASRGSLDALEVKGSSQARLVQLTPPITIVEGGSVHVPVPGVMPDVSAPQLLHVGEPLQVEFLGAPGTIWVLAAADGFQWVEIPGWELVGLVDLVTFSAPDFGTFDVAGMDSRTYTLPVTTPLGSTFAVQLLTVDLSTNAIRWSNVTSIVTAP